MAGLAHRSRFSEQLFLSEMPQKADSMPGWSCPGPHSAVRSCNLLVWASDGWVERALPVGGFGGRLQQFEKPERRKSWRRKKIHDGSGPRVRFRVKRFGSGQKPKLLAFLVISCVGHSMEFRHLQIPRVYVRGRHKPNSSPSSLGSRKAVSGIYFITGSEVFS